MDSVEELTTLFNRIGLESKKAAETAKNKKLSKNLEGAIREAGCEDGTERPIGILLYALASTCPTSVLKHRGYIAKKVASGPLTNEEQLQAAYKFVATVPEGESINEKDFNAACGVGVKVLER